MYGNCYTFNNRENETILSTSMGGSEYGKGIRTNSEYVGSRTVGALRLPEMQGLSIWPETRDTISPFAAAFTSAFILAPSFSVSVFLSVTSPLHFRERESAMVTSLGFLVLENHSGLSL